jgi:hypothetical protein
MATEYAAPFVGSPITTSQQFRDRVRPTQQNMVDDTYGGTALAVTNNGNIAVNVANGPAIVQGSRYELTGGPLSLAVAANGGGSNRYDVVCLTYDAAHNPPVYARIVQGTAGAGLPALNSSVTGVWDFPLADYEKQPGGTIVNIRDRRKFSDGAGGIVMADPADTALYPHAPRIGENVTRWPSGAVATWDGTAWETTGWARKFRPVEASNTTNQITTNTSFEAGSPQVTLTYTAPPSGMVYVTVSSTLECWAPSVAYCGFEVRQTNVSGLIFLAASPDDAMAMQADDLTSASRRKLVTGLTYNSPYFFRTMHRTSNSANQGSIFVRSLLIEPVV